VTKKKKRKQDGSIETPDTAATETSGISLYDVRYALDNRLSPEVERSRVNIAMLGTTARRRIGEDSVGPSLLSRMSAKLHRPQSENIVAAARPTPRIYSTAWLLLESVKKTAKGELKIIKALQYKKKSEKGWLRNLEFLIDPASAPKNFTTDSAIKLHLSEAEKEKAMKVLIAAKPHDSAVPLVAYAWGVAESTLRTWYNSMIHSNGTKVVRKQRSEGHLPACLPR
jgi:hypothetical protein